jgi:hypothetical protein
MTQIEMLDTSTMYALYFIVICIILGGIAIPRNKEIPYHITMFGIATVFIGILFHYINEILSNLVTFIGSIFVYVGATYVIVA